MKKHFCFKGFKERNSSNYPLNLMRVKGRSYSIHGPGWSMRPDNKSFPFGFIRRRKGIVYAKVVSNYPFHLPGAEESKNPNYFSSFASIRSKFIRVDKLIEIDFEELDCIVILEKSNLRFEVISLIEDSCYLLYSKECDLYINNTDRRKLFAEAFNWLFSFQIGFIVPDILSKILQDDFSKNLFKKDFLEFQENRYLRTFFYWYKEIVVSTLPPLIILYFKPNLLKLIRLIMATYNPSMWGSLSMKEQYQFSKKIINLSRVNGCYSYINGLFNKIDRNVNNNEVFLSFSIGEKETPISIGVGVSVPWQTPSALLLSNNNNAEGVGVSVPSQTPSALLSSNNADLVLSYKDINNICFIVSFISIKEIMLTLKMPLILSAMAIVHNKKQKSWTLKIVNFVIVPTVGIVIFLYLVCFRDRSLTRLPNYGGTACFATMSNRSPRLSSSGQGNPVGLSGQLSLRQSTQIVPTGSTSSPLIQERVTSYPLDAMSSGSTFGSMLISPQSPHNFVADIRNLGQSAVARQENQTSTDRQVVITQATAPWDYGNLDLPCLVTLTKADKEPFEESLEQVTGIFYPADQEMKISSLTEEVFTAAWRKIDGNLVAIDKDSQLHMGVRLCTDPRIANQNGEKDVQLILIQIEADRSDPKSRVKLRIEVDCATPHNHENKKVVTTVLPRIINIYSDMTYKNLDSLQFLLQNKKPNVNNSAKSWVLEAITDELVLRKDISCVKALLLKIKKLNIKKGDTINYNEIKEVFTLLSQRSSTIFKVDTSEMESCHTFGERGDQSGSRSRSVTYRTYRGTNGLSAWDNPEAAKTPSSNFNSLLEQQKGPFNKAAAATAKHMQKEINSSESNRGALMASIGTDITKAHYEQMRWLQLESFTKTQVEIPLRAAGLNQAQIDALKGPMALIEDTIRRLEDNQILVREGLQKVLDWLDTEQFTIYTKSKFRTNIPEIDGYYSINEAVATEYINELWVLMKNVRQLLEEGTQSVRLNRNGNFLIGAQFATATNKQDEDFQNFVTNFVLIKSGIKNHFIPSKLDESFIEQVGFRGDKARAQLIENVGLISEINKRLEKHIKTLQLFPNIRDYNIFNKDGDGKISPQAVLCHQLLSLEELSHYFNGTILKPDLITVPPGALDYTTACRETIDMTFNTVSNDYSKNTIKDIQENKKCPFIDLPQELYPLTDPYTQERISKTNITGEIKAIKSEYTRDSYKNHLKKRSTIKAKDK